MIRLKRSLAAKKGHAYRIMEECFARGSQMGANVWWGKYLAYDSLLQELNEQR